MSSLAHIFVLLNQIHIFHFSLVHEKLLRHFLCICFVQNIIQIPRCHTNIFVNQIPLILAETLLLNDLNRGLITFWLFR